MCDYWGGRLGIRSTSATICWLGWAVGVFGHDIGMMCCPPDVTISLQNLLGGNIGGICKQLIIL